MAEENLSVTLKKPSYSRRILGELWYPIVFSIASSGFFLYFGDSGYLTFFIVIVLGSFIPFIKRAAQARYYLYKIAQTENVFNVNVLDGDGEKSLVLDLTKTKIILEQKPESRRYYRTGYRLSFFDNMNNLLFIQFPIGQWTDKMLLELYAIVEDYNPENRLYITDWPGFMNEKKAYRASDIIATSQTKNR